MWDSIRIVIMIWLLTAIIIAFILGVRVAGGSGTYRITYYDSSFSGQLMYCEEEAFDPGDLSIAATGADGFACGTRLQVCTDTDTCLLLTVQDRCGGCSGQHIDVSEAAWKVLGEEDYGTVEQAIQLPNTGIGQ